MTVMIGVDPHKGSHTAVAADEREAKLDEVRVRSGPRQLERLLQWAQRFPERTWAIENATGLGYLLAQQLVAAGERVIDVQPKLAARVRLLATESINKNDPHDAYSVAIAALRAKTPRMVRAEDDAAVMKLWSKRHRDLARHRNRIACRLHSLLCELVAGGVPDEISAEKAERLLADVDAAGAVSAARVELAEELLDDLRRLDVQIKESRKRLDQVVNASGPVMPTTSAATTGPTPNTSVVVVATSAASPAATTSPRSTARHRSRCPLVAAKTYRLSRRGNRQLNHALHCAAVTQIRFKHSAGRAFVRPRDRPRQDPQRSAPRAQAAGQRRPLRPHGRRRTPSRTPGDSGPGRATGERLCRQRGRLTPRNTGSSAKPLPNPETGYDQPLVLATRGVTLRRRVNPANCLTNKEDSFGPPRSIRLLIGWLRRPGVVCGPRQGACFMSCCASWSRPSNPRCRRTDDPLPSWRGT